MTALPQPIAVQSVTPFRPPTGTTPASVLNSVPATSSDHAVSRSSGRLTSLPGSPEESPDKQGRRARRRSKAVAVPASRAPEEWICEPGEFNWLPEVEYQELWFELRSWSWSSLAVVPTVAGRSEFDVAERLVVMGTTNTNQRYSLISAEGIGVADTDRVVSMIRAAEARGERVIVACDAVSANPATVPVVRSVNAVVPVVMLGKTDRTALERCVAAAGRARVLGVLTKD
jgi:hypothetical protein